MTKHSKWLSITVHCLDYKDRADRDILLYKLMHDPIWEKIEKLVVDV